MTITTTLSQTETATAADEGDLDKAIEQGDATPATTAESTPADQELTLAVLEKMTDDQLDAFLTKGTEDLPAPNAAKGETAAPAASEVKTADGQGTGEDEGGNPGEMIPRARLNQEIDKRKKLEEENERLREDRAYNAGRADALAKSGAQPEVTVDPVEVITQNLGRLQQNYRAGVINLAKKYDDGDLTTEQWREKEQELEDAYNRLKGGFEQDLQEAREVKSRPNPDDLMNHVRTHQGLADFTAELNAANPWLEKIDPALNTALQQKAETILSSQGLSLSNRPTAQELVQYTADLRQAIVMAAKEWGLDKIPAATGTPAPATTPQAATPAQIKSKLDLAKAQPPSPTLAGAALPTDAIATLQTDQMSVDQLASLTPAQLDALAERESKRGQAA